MIFFLMIGNFTSSSTSVFPYTKSTLNKVYAGFTDTKWFLLMSAYVLHIYLLCRNIQWCYLCFSLINCLVLSLIEVLLFPMFFQLINFCVYYIRLSLSIQGTLNLIDSRAPFYLFWAWYYFLNLGSIILWLL